MTDAFENLSVPELEKLIEETSEILKKATEQVNGKIDQHKEKEKELAPVAEQYAKLFKEKKEIEESIARMKPLVAEQRKRLEELRHWLRRAELMRLERDKLQELSKELDLLTANAPWREFAFPHQIEGAKRIALVGGRALLGDKRGLGKSLTSLIACDMIKARKIVVLAPKETIRNFENEIKTWAPHRSLMSMISLPPGKRGIILDTLQFTDEFVLTINLEAWRRDENLIQQVIKLQPDTVVIDEAHYIKSSKTHVFNGVKQIVHAQNMCAMCGENNLIFGMQYMECATAGCDAKYQIKDPNCMSVKHVIPMTGTMILNTPEDLWGLLNLVDEENFRQKGAFLNRYCRQIVVTDEDGKNRKFRWVFSPGGESALVKKLGAQLIQRDRHSAGIKIPPQKIQFYDLDFDREKYPKQYRAYRELQNQFLIFSNKYPDEVLSVNQAITHILRSRQMMTWPMGIKMKDPLTGEVVFQCDVDESIKIDMAVDLAKEFIEEGERVVLFSQFVAPLEELHRRLSHTPVETQGGRVIKPVLLYGGTSERQREFIRYDFDAKNKSNENDIVLCHYRVGGQSLNFTAASQMIIVDEEWNPGKNDQAYGRIDRIGQTKETTVHVLQVDNTIDTFMRKLNEFKQQIIEGFEGQINYAAQIRKAIEDGEM